ncbi:MAG: type I methionyl aminopeptidase [Candidatus Kerfeldbacteria bacterium]|nr:type I methionyl aminopeptidase [Candidatus Kerfeldbacteria bacterium]
MKFRPFQESELTALRRSGAVLADALAAVVEAVKPGVDALMLNLIAEEAIRRRGGTPAFLGYHGYPASLCVSLNDEVVHGIPRQSTILHSGDIVGLDLGVIVDGMYTDMARSVGVGEISAPRQKLLDVTRQSLAAGLRVVKAGIRTGDIGAAVQGVAEAAGFGVVRDLVGHGVGRAVHDEPSIPNFGRANTGERLPAGICLAIEPMLTLGDYEVETDDDGWTVRTVDGSAAAHEERTILVTADGYELLTPVS